MTLRLFIPADAGALAVGAEEVASALRAAAARQKVAVDVVRTGSRGLYWLEPMVEVQTATGRVAYGPVAASDAEDLLRAILTDGAHALRQGLAEEIPWLKRQTRLTFARCGVVDPRSLEDYRAHDGCKGLERALALGPTATVEEVVQSGLRGRGGAGFPTGIKWRTVAQTPPQQKYIVCNADEGDSGTFADRMIMEGDPFVLIEGMAIAGIAVGATKGYVYIRSEYPHAAATMEAAIAAARRGGMLGNRIANSSYAFDMEVRVGAGAYVCGEETSLLDSLEGKRGLVRAKPPLPAHKGLFGRPTVINNVLSFASVPIIMDKGGAFYRDFGMGKSRGTMPIQLAGNIKYGGLFETAFGITLGELVDDVGGGTRSGRPVRAVQVGGPLGAYFPARLVRYAVRLRGLRRPRRSDRPWRHRGLRRHRRHGETGAFRHGILRHRVLRQVHAVPRRLDARRRGHRPHHPWRESRRQYRAAGRPVPYPEVRFALRARRLHALSGDERADLLP